MLHISEWRDVVFNSIEIVILYKPLFNKGYSIHNCGNHHGDDKNQ